MPIEGSNFNFDEEEMENLGVRILNSYSINEEEEQLYNCLVSQIESVQDMQYLIEEKGDSNIFTKINEQRV